ncbi:MAG: DUF2807 domain-containing protein [Candidatus Bathyarchaeota archaeon]|nr:MAG: DUF2807 domain-containing protein [Candidatus Bathyarchaeota archaeon]
MFKRRFDFRPLGLNKRAIGNLAIILLIIIIVGSVLSGVVLILSFWPVLRYETWPRVDGSGNLIAQENDLSDFTTVDVGNAFDIEITQSNSYSINITADDNLFDYIEVFKTGEKLTIRLMSGYSYRFVTTRAEITMPGLYELQCSGATHGTVVGFNSSHEFVLGLSGASSLNGDFTTSEDAQFTLSGASFVELEGAANDLGTSASGASHLDLEDFPVHNADVNLSGASHATVNLDGELDGNLSGASHLLYTGDPTTIDVSTSGFSTVGEK